MVSLATAMGIGRFVYTPLLPALMTGTGLTVSQAGWIASANFVGYLLGAILGGGGWAHGKERAIALISLLASSLLAAAMGLSHDFLVFVIIRFAAGLASAFCLVFTTTIVFARLAQANRMDLQSVVFSGVGLGIALSSVLTGIVYFEEARWQTGWFASGVLSLVGTLIVFLLLAPTAKTIGAGSRELPLPKSRPFWAMTLAYGFFGAGYVVTATFLIAIVRVGDGGAQMEAGVWLVTGIAAFLSLHVWKAAVASIGLVMAFAVACVIESLGVMASVLIPGMVGAIVGGALLGGTFVVITAYGLAAGRMSAPDAPRKALAVMTAAFGIGQVIAPIAAGYLADWTGGFLVPSIGAALLLLVSAATAVGFGSESRAHRT
ncbi:YbfB/YjiJ family MFS transporter [Tianweitania sp. BSSL-BM11]|uniref:YbfB/YjiJ family MFS transporter n=2 Tax=Tianweitania aestuarii TaxID=2814886 RepID=A0ABS5RRN8_9HYPH|nr:YbfB/YjiJ family MFS transporter [Tianweitania aestuarii]